MPATTPFSFIKISDVGADGWYESARKGSHVGLKLARRSLRAGEHNLGRAAALARAAEKALAER